MGRSHSSSNIYLSSTGAFVLLKVLGTYSTGKFWERIWEWETQISTFPPNLKFLLSPHSQCLLPAFILMLEKFVTILQNTNGSGTETPGLLSIICILKTLPRMWEEVQQHKEKKMSNIFLLPPVVALTGAGSDRRREFQGVKWEFQWRTHFTQNQLKFLSDGHNRVEMNYSRKVCMTCPISLQTYSSYYHNNPYLRFKIILPLL